MCRVVLDKVGRHECHLAASVVVWAHDAHHMPASEWTPEELATLARVRRVMWLRDPGLSVDDYGRVAAMAELAMDWVEDATNMHPDCGHLIDDSRLVEFCPEWVDGDDSANRAHMRELAGRLERVLS